MLPFNSRNKLFKGITHISKKTIDENIPLIYKPFNSTTLNFETAVSFANTDSDEFRIVLILTVPPELNVYNYMDEYDEYEILLERNTIISNFVYNSYDKKNKVHVYNPLPFYIPHKASQDFLNLRIDKTKPAIKMKIYDINRR